MAYLFIAATGHGPAQSRVDRIVVHGTVSGSTTGQAAANARYLQKVGLSPHYLADPGTTVQMLDGHLVGYHDGYNFDELGLELCDQQAGSPARWADADHQATLRRGAQIVAALCHQYGVPPVYVVAPLGGKRGICGHRDVTNTWHLSTHQDPYVAGPFPWAQFMAMVGQYYGGVAKPVVPTPAPEVPVPYTSKPVLREGARGPAVKQAQALLAAAGYPPGSSFNAAGIPDGIFGAGSANTVRAYQAAVRKYATGPIRTQVQVTGVVDAATWTALLI